MSSLPLVMINFPKDGQPIQTIHNRKDGNRYFYFVASGRFDPSIVGLTAVCEGSGGYKVRGDRLALRDLDPELNLWHFLFHIPEANADNYTIRITGTDGSGVEYTQSTHVPIRLGFGSTIAWPEDGEDVSAYKDEFTPYGDLRAPIDVLTLQYTSPSYNNVVTRLGYVEDFTNEFIWVGQFASLGPNLTFRLTFRDLAAAPASFTIHPKTFS